MDRVVEGVTQTILIDKLQQNSPIARDTMGLVTMYKLEVGDEIYCRVSYGNPLTNLNSYTSDDTLNSFWGIRMDY